jgi:protein O-mannosyl-transferase
MNRRKSPAKAPAGTGRRDQRWGVTAVCVGLAAITFAVFGQTMTHDFVDYDDDVYVYENSMVSQGLTLKGIVWAFTRTDASNWHPLTWLSHMLDCQLYGLHPGGHHLTNVLLHTATVIALFLVLRQMTGAFWRSAFVAAVFAIHPLRVESVAWVAERKDVLSGLFFMLTIGTYARYARNLKSQISNFKFHYAATLLLFAMGLMCKPMLVTLPVVLLLLDYWPLQRTESRKLSWLVMEKLPLLALSGAGCVATLLAQNEAVQPFKSFSLPLRLANALASCMIYIVQMVWPAGLAVFYPSSHNGLPPWEVALAGLLLAGLSIFAWAQRRKQPWLLVGWLWYLVMLLPVVGIIQVGDQAHADRYTYLPGIGLAVAMTWCVGSWSLEWKHRKPVLGAGMAAVTAALMICAWKQTTHWKNSETLWTHTLACTTGNYMAHYNFGNVLRQEGKLDEALTQLQQGVQINPSYEGAHINFGIVLAEKGRLDEAIAQFQQALKLQPNDADAHYNLGRAFRQQGRLGEAITQYQKALEIKPDNAEIHYNLGNIFNQQGRLDAAITQFQQTLQINPGYWMAHNNLGNAFLNQGNFGEAIAHFQQALQHGPAEPGIENNLAWLLAVCPEASLRNGNKALELAQQANASTGGKNPTVLHTLAAALAETGRFSEAQETARRALRLAEAQSNTSLAGQIQLEINCYQADSPYHLPAQPAAR